MRKIVAFTLFLLMLAAAAPTFVRAQNSLPADYEKQQKKEMKKWEKQRRKEQRKQEKQMRKDQKRAEKDYKLLHPSTKK